MDLRRKRKILWVSLWALAALVALGALLEKSWLIVAAVAAVLVWLVLELSWWRCPHCGKFLGHLDQKTYCPYCGESLYEE